MKFSCKKCNGEITYLTILKTFTFRDDYGLIKVKETGVYQKFDREYFSDKVESIMANCENCGGIELDENDPNIEDFIRDSEQILEEDIKNKEYGNAIIVKSKDNLVIKV